MSHPSHDHITPKLEEEEEEGIPESVNEEGDEELQGFDFENDFDPMQALGQLLVTPEGETIPDVLVKIHHTLDTLTKVLHKISKSLDTKK